MRLRNTLVLVLVAIVAAAAWFHAQPPALSAWMLDVGQGESVLVQEPGGRTILFDGGPDDKVLSQIGSVLPFWKRDIDLMILSHTHLDHVAGLVSVLGRYAVHEAWISGAVDTTAEFKEFTRLLAEKRVPVTHRFWNDQPCDSECPAPERFGAARLQLYHPMEDMTGKKPAQQHDADLVVKVSYLGQSLLLTGDLNEGHEKDMLAACRQPSCTLRATVLQIPHHGSATGLVPEFLSAIAPQAALIPVGNGNKYRHPTPTTLAKLTQANVPTYRTDTQGRIHVVLNGYQLRIQPERDG